MKLDPTTLLETWTVFKETGDLEARNALVVHYADLVRYQAIKLSGPGGLAPMVERDDLISYGTFGLIDAIDKFDMANGAKFQTYAVSRIKGAIFDELRMLDWVPRSVRSKARTVEKAQEEVEALLGRVGSPAEVAEYLGIGMDEYWVLCRQSTVRVVEMLYKDMVNQDFSMTLKTYDHYLHDPTIDLEEGVQVEEIVHLISQSISKMDERSKLILVLYYIQEMTLAEIGQILGVTESRVCQMQSKVLSSLGEGLGQSFAA